MEKRQNYFFVRDFQRRFRVYAAIFYSVAFSLPFYYLLLKISRYFTRRLSQPLQTCIFVFLFNVSCFKISLLFQWWRFRFTFDFSSFSFFLFFSRSLPFFYIIFVSSNTASSISTFKWIFLFAYKIPALRNKFCRRWWFYFVLYSH